MADDFTKIDGIGPTLADRLVKAGIETFAEIAAWSAEDVAAIDKALKLKNRIVTGEWQKQAAILAAESNPDKTYVEAEAAPAPVVRAKKGLKLDRSKRFSTIYGAREDGAAFIQDGVAFDVEGFEIE